MGDMADYHSDPCDDLVGPFARLLSERPLVDVTKPHYILWNPSSDLPPTVRFATIDGARKAAERMARKSEGETFHICMVIGAVKAAETPIEVKMFPRKGAK